MPAGDVPPDSAGVGVELMGEWGGEGSAEGFGYCFVVGVGVGAKSDGLVWGVGGFCAGEFVEPSPVLARVLPLGVFLH